MLTWQLQTPIDAIVFDCDGTLSTIDGIDELAKLNGVGTEVQALTTKAMSQSGINPDIYLKRMELVKPSKEQVIALGKHYFTHQVTDIYAVIQLLQRLNKTVYIVSAGLNPAVSIFGESLKIKRNHIFAVEVFFNSQGHYADYQKTSVLIKNHGKRILVNRLKAKHERIIHVGDGLNDYVTHDIVTRFIGYGGAFYRESMANACQYYIKTPSMSPLLALALTMEESEKLSADEKNLYQQGWNAIQQNEVMTEMEYA